MAETAAKLVDRVLPEVPVRQWVLSMPWRLRYLLASDPALCAAVRRSFLRAVFAFYSSRLEREGLSNIYSVISPGVGSQLGIQCEVLASSLPC